VGFDQPLEEVSFHRGLNGPYHWLTVTGDVYMGTLLRLCPEVVVNRYVAVTSLDCGIRRLSSDETEAGWKCISEVAYSPRIDLVDTLRFQRDGLDFPGYDEWYVFETPSKLGEIFRGNYFDFQPGGEAILVFVSMLALVLHDPHPYLPGILDIFWSQIKVIDPDTFIADGRVCLTIVTKRKILLDDFQERLLTLRQARLTTA
jgi:hypothetical protein